MDDIFSVYCFWMIPHFGIFGYFLTLMEMTSLMTGFILNGLSESLLSSRLFRIKAWVLQVPFLSMIFLYFFDYSNLNHSKVFYLFLYYNNFSVSLCRYVAFFRETLETLETLCLFLHSPCALLYLFLFCFTWSFLLWRFFLPFLHADGMCLMYIIRFIGCILFLLFPLSLMSH